MKKRIRYFIAAVQDLYQQYIITIMKKGRGYRHPEEFYVPVYLYSAMFKKVAEYNEILWSQEQFIKDMLQILLERYAYSEIGGTFILI